MDNQDFSTLPIQEAYIRALAHMEIKTMTPIQEQAIPLLLEGKDVLAQSPTGSGKTFAYVLPLLHRVEKENTNVQAIILCPTRELAIQVVAEIQKLTMFSEGIRTLAIYGGQSIERQILGLKKHPQIIVGTPGRVIDHIDRRTLKLENVRMVVLDEGDEMLRIGFKEDIDTILSKTPEEKQMALFSATLPDTIKTISATYQTNPKFIQVKPQKTDIPAIKQYYLSVHDSDKEAALTRLIDAYQHELVLVFCRTKRKVDSLQESLVEQGYASEALHGDLSQAQRERVMKQFRQGKLHILVATDVAARGLDIDDIDAVFNYDVAEDEEFYIHRIGRTARAGKSGVSYVFLTRRELPLVKHYEKLTKATLEKIEIPSETHAQVSQTKKLVDSLLPILEANDQEAFKEDLMEAINRINQEQLTHYSPLDFAAAFMAKILNKKKPTEALRNNPDIVIDDIPLLPKSQLPISKPNDGSYQRFFINLGMKDHLTQRHLASLIVLKCDIMASDINDVYVRDTFSFFEVKKELTSKVVAAFSNLSLDSRQIDVELADNRIKKPDSKPFSSHKPSSFRPHSSTYESSPKSRFSREGAPRHGYPKRTPKN